MQIFPLGEGSYSVDASKKFVPFDPQTDNPKDRPASLFIHVNPFLVKTDTDLILLDTGLGYKDTRDELYLHQHIRNAGFDPEDVTLVLMSHLHYDHSGELKPGIKYELSGGHCPYHQVFWIEGDDKKCFFGGDELPEPEQLIRKFIAKYDYDGRKAMMLREEYGKKAAAEGWICLFYHAKLTTAGKVTYTNDHFGIIPA